MTRLLFIQASPRSGQSKSIQVAEAYLAAGAVVWNQFRIPGLGRA